MRHDNTFIALGANLPSAAGSPSTTLQAALTYLQDASAITVTAISRFYATPAFPAGSGPDYVNACARLQTTLSPHDLLACLHQIEARLGRRRDTGRWAARGIDLDLLAMGDAILPDAQAARHWREMPLSKQSDIWPDQLILPHPRLQDRPFVLVPLADIAGNWHHPATGQRLADMLAALPARDRDAIHPITRDQAASA